MTLTVTAIYENGVLRPLTPLALQEHTRVRLNFQTVAENQTPAKPPTLEHCPPEMRAELAAMDDWSDAALWEAAQAAWPTAHAERLHFLTYKLNWEGLTEAEQAELAQAHEAADQFTLRKAYAYALLQWRGYRLPTLSELEAQL